MNTKEDIERLRQEAEERRSNAIHELHNLHDDISTKADKVDVLVLNARRGIRAGEINIPQLLDDLHEARVLLEDIQNDVGQASREADTAETFVAVPVKTVPTPPRFETGVHVDPDGTAQPYARCVSGHKPVDPEAERLAATDYSTGTVTMSTADEAAVDVDGRAIWEDHFPEGTEPPYGAGPDRHAWVTGYDDGLNARPRPDLPPNFNVEAWRKGWRTGLLARETVRFPSQAETDAWDEAVGVAPEPSHTEPASTVSEHARQEARAWRAGYNDGSLNREPLKLTAYVHRCAYNQGYADGQRAYQLTREEA